MERSEPALVPEWLRGTGNVAGAGNSAQQFASPSNHADTPTVADRSRNRSSKTNGDFDSTRSIFFERTASSNSRRSSINGSAKHAYSSFNRSNRDKDRDREKDRSSFSDQWDRGSSERIETETLQRSHSMLSRKQSETLIRRVVVNTKSGGSSNQNNGNGILSGGSISSVQKAFFDKDFPSLGAEEKQGIAEIGRVPSPGLGSAASQSLPVGNSALIRGEGWTSALAEVPTIIGSSNPGFVMVQQNATAASGSVASSTAAGLNMAEALAQTPSQARSAPQVPNSSEKSKPKAAVRSTEMSVSAKSLPQQPSGLHSTSQSVRNVNTKVEAPKTCGKFTDLKSVVWENGVSPTFSKEVSNLTNSSIGKSGSQHAVASAVAYTPSKNTNYMKSPTVEKRHSHSHSQSRNDFFNLIKKKTLMNSSTVVPDSIPVVSSPISEKSGELNGVVVKPSVYPQSTGNGPEVTSNGNAHAYEESQRLSDSEEKDSIPSATISPDEEEAAFLRSLGWEENSDEDEGLTEEEINAFYQEVCKKLGPTTFKLCQGMQPNLSKLFESYASNLHGASAELSSSNSGSEA
ncbi:mediator of RNA polymerase II transcription subunit 1 isoform X4 [Arachis ipaensis]|uniref:mediator of RNA polymerase II transcription subunit 1 isoform X4 n=1 Tax=Arachis ipaensis TaxID=130454 RepID=UPI000A2B82CC|nr:mediator of RNA polymerase II transcription subunit 1 isoform X4 [Arachis ipaensis]